MHLRNTPDRWGLVARLFHWLFFLLIIGAWLAVELHEDYPRGSAERAQWMWLHKSFGVTVFFLIWLRLGWRLGNEVPTPEPGPRWQRWTSSLVHAALYLLMIAMPLSGLVMSQFGGREVSWFGVVEIPVWVSPDRELAGQIKELHEHVLWPALFWLIALHAAAALWHHIIRKDNTLRRMLPWAQRP